MSQPSQILVLFGLQIAFLLANGYTYTEMLNTESGYCEGPNYGKIKIGEHGYNDKSCEKILCHAGYSEVLGCGQVTEPNDSQCEVVRGIGQYPNCCKELRCI